ncbi:VanZ family protein [Paenibacillus sp. LHD-117]|uniref:VanZ family protein n=1 Tax=Paenibacillus sp. LHD-117 TaxID=3071412 RepID=UPI0027E1CBEC|nr:VanZ family protein [Paenibacillus sp. LHD-117]MDQ6420870.1 VanZ family protein [Paenibacillus sp. LHD-117]
MNQIQPNIARPSALRLFRFVPAVAWMTVIFILSSRTGDEINTMLPFFQRFFPGMTDFNWGHFVSYFLLAAAFDYGFGARSERWGMKVFIVVLCGLYGITDELHQSMVGGRMMDAADVRNDCIGAAVWTILVAIPPIKRLWRKGSK